MKLLSLTTALSLFLLASPLLADDVDNPQFAAWNKFPVGTSVTLEGKMNMAGQTTAMQSVRTLKEKADDHVVIEVVTTVEAGGKKQPTRPIPRTIKTKLDKNEVNELGKDKVEAAGKTYDCTTYDMKDVSPNYIGGKPKLWLCPDVPGGIVKFETSTSAGTASLLLKTITLTK